MAKENTQHMIMNDNIRKKVVDESFDSIIGQEQVKKDMKSALLMDRHIVLIGNPGIGKTTLAKSVAKVLPDLKVNDCGFNCSPDNPVCPECVNNPKQKIKVSTGNDRFVRIQGSPDLTAEDLLGDIDPIKAIKFGPLSIEAFTPGKIFKANNGILFFDEVNRCSEKLQNALLQVLEEKRVTIGSYSVDFPAKFIFIGTMNPEDTSTEPLSDVFLDRFDMIYMTYPETLAIEKRIVLMNGKTIDGVTFPEDVLDTALHFIRTLREDSNIEKKPSVRASLGIYERAQAVAFLSESKTVTSEHVKEVMLSVLSHRIKLKPSIKYLETPEKYLSEEFQKFKGRKSGYT
ncbi:MAG TPA: ATP-binding protein [Alphaproteobacteria bacterium]|nr:ATP-binding protein [Alphaproteobacteria bacterium]